MLNWGTHTASYRRIRPTENIYLYVSCRFWHRCSRRFGRASFGFWFAIWVTYSVAHVRHYSKAEKLVLFLAKVVCFENEPTAHPQSRHTPHRGTHHTHALGLGGASGPTGVLVRARAAAGAVPGQCERCLAPVPLLQQVSPCPSVAVSSAAGAAAGIKSGLKKGGPAPPPPSAAPVRK